MVILWSLFDRGAAGSDPALRRHLHETSIGNLAKSLIASGFEAKTHFGLEAPEVTNKDLIVTLGSPALKQAQTLGLVRKGRVIGSLREMLLDGPNGSHIMVSYHPDVKGIDHSMWVDFCTDWRLIRRFAKQGNIKPKLGVYRYVQNLSEFCEQVKALHAVSAKPVPVALDLETQTFDCYNPETWIVSVQVSCREGYSDVLYFRKEDIPEKQVLQQIEWLLNAPEVLLVGANLKYDLGWIYQKWGFTCSNFKCDTGIFGSLLDENASNSLKTHVKLFTDELGGYDDELDSEYDKGNMAQIPLEVLLPYAAGDSDGTLRVYQAFKKKIHTATDTPTKRLARFYGKLLHPAARAYELVERCGVCVDQEKYAILRADLQAKTNELDRKALELIPEWWVRVNTKGKKKGFSLSNKLLLAKYFFDPAGLGLEPKSLTPTGKYSSTVDHLSLFADDPKAKDLAALLDEHSEASKVLSTYVEGFLKHLKADGRFHPTYFLYQHGHGDGGTRTGRLSAKDPAYQCLKGDTLVLTSKGYLTIESIVCGLEQGLSFVVLTHTGKWKRVIGGYRNGVQPVFEVKLSSGRTVPSTANHPYLTDRGWVRTDKLNTGDRCCVTRFENWKDIAYPRHAQNPDILQLGSYEESVYIPNEQRLPKVWGSWNNLMRGVDDLRRILDRHGYKTWERLVHRAFGCKPRVLQSKLHMGNPSTTGKQSKEYQAYNMEWEDPNRGAVGQGVWYIEGEAALSTGRVKLADGGSLDEDSPQERRYFKEDPVVSITPIGEFETFDLTIEDSHSFIANGVVVHNTVPKRGTWAKRLRECIKAPPGFVICEFDYSQGELRIIAEVADDPTMLGVYIRGEDLHARSGAAAAGLTWDEMLALSVSDHEKYELIRQGGKPVNFGYCIAKGQRVLTNKGLIPIEKVTLDHKLWDGIEWVSHGGVKFTGKKRVIGYGGIRATRYHEVFTEQGLLPFWYAASKGLRLIQTGSGNAPIRLRESGNTEGYYSTGGQIHSGYNGMFGMPSGIHYEYQQHIVGENYQLQVPIEVWGGQGYMGFPWGSVSSNGSTLQSGFPRIIETLSRSGYRGRIQIPRGVYQVGFGNLSQHRFQGFGLRQDRQQRELLPEQFEAGYQIGKLEEPQEVEVFDIIDAGPRHRFTCEGKLVHNCYGMGWKKYMEYARTQYGQIVTAAQSQTTRNAFFSTYDRLLPWHKRVRQLAHKQGYIESPLGRIRHLPLIHSSDEVISSGAERQAINSPVQATLSDMSLWGTAILNQRYGFDPKGFCCNGMIHDALYFQVPEDKLDIWKPRIVEVMENLPFQELGWNPRVKFTVDGKAGYNLADMKKL